jgi:hypothetical protein
VPPQTEALAYKDMRRALRNLDAEVQACLALNRATLRALAAISPMLTQVAEAACEDEAERAGSPRVAEVLDGVRERLGEAPAEARMVCVLERALAEAADALPSQTGRSST